MELNEQLSADSATAIEVFEKEIYSEVSSIIDGYNDTSTTTTQLLKVKEYYFKKKYLLRILERLDD